VPERIDVAVVGAGPFGLSIAAHVQRRSVRTFGAHMQTWRTRMPKDMFLRSAWEETSLSAPDDAGSIDEWASTVGERVEPIPLELFLRYSDWFTERFVSDLDPNDVALIEPDGARFRLTTTGGDELDVRSVVLAVGVTPFPHVPEPLAGFFGESVSLATGVPEDLERLAGRRVLVVGGGQAGLETSGLAAQSGAEVELVTRGELRWFADREPHYPRSPFRQRLYRIAYPAVGYGPPPMNRLVLHPDLFAALPMSARLSLTKRLLRSGGSPWLRTLVDKSVVVREHCTVASVTPSNGGVAVDLTDGERREVDHVLVACGYRFKLDRLAFLAPELRARIAVQDGWPVLDRFFRSTDPNVSFVGYAAERRFGPISRFVLGSDFTARRLAPVLNA
jgi:cation diffusion facilitator CzcD-associated flavoprotein CzcO